MKLNPSQIGQIVELKCQSFIISQNWNVLVPIGNYQPYDFIIEKDNKYYKIQVKHAVSRDNSFVVATKKSARADGKTVNVRYEENDLDFFMTEYKNQFYIFPNFGTKETKFWLVQPRQKNSKLAKDYYAENILKTL